MTSSMVEAMFGSSDIVAGLAAVCRATPLRVKWLLVPSLRVGRQWIDGACRSVAVVNVRPITLRRLAYELARPELRKRQLRLIDPPRAELLVRRVLERTADNSYLQWSAPTAAVVSAVSRTIRDLRLAGVVDQLPHRDVFEVAAKGLELQRIVADYVTALRDARLVDQADVLELAIGRLSTDSAALGRDALVLWPERPPGSYGLRLWHAVAGRQRRLLTSEVTAAVAGGERRDVELLRYVDNPTAAPAARGDGTLQVRLSVGEITEVRQVLRCCLQQQLPLDQVELLYCDSELYPPLILSVMRDVFGSTPPVTFAEGLPVRLFRPGRALAAWVRWQQEDYAAATLASMMQDRLLVSDEQEPSLDSLATRLRALSIGAGRERYLSRIDEALHREGGGGETVAELSALRTLVVELLGDVPLTDARGVLDAATRFVKERAGGGGKEDAFARRALLRALQRQRDSVEAIGRGGGAPEMLSADAWDWLAGLPAGLQIGGLGPRPGCLHAASVWSGGHARRQNVFIVGMDDRHFPGGERQDPLLLDRERRRLSDQLSTATGRRGQRSRRCRELLARIGARSAKVILSASPLRLADGRELHPSGELLAAARLLLPGESARLPSSFAPASESECCTPQDWWSWRLGDDRKGGSERIAGAYPHLDRGFVARRERRSDRFTEYDGYVPLAGERHDPWRPGATALSATALEMLGRCPMDYFCRHVLGIEVPAHYRRLGAELWPGAGRRGAMLHEVFYRFLTGLQHRRQQPSWPRDARALAQLVDEQIARLCSVDTPPDALARQRLSDELHRTASIFLREEHRQCRTSVPYCFEASIGVPAGEVSTPLDSASPVAIPLGARGSVPFRGKIDRVDLLPGRGAGMRFVVWDYKTGSSYRYDERDAFRAGRSLQPFVYRALVEAQLRRAVSPQARVVRFGFFFPGVREHGRRIAWAAESLAEGEQIVADLCAMIAAGCFPCSDAVEDMDGSPYEAIYVGAVDAARVSRRKLDGTDPLLDRFRRLRGRHV